MTSADESRRWYAVWVKPRCEFKVEKSLEIRGVANFLPRYRVHKAWSDRVREAEVLLFPGYVFCHIRPDQRLAVLTTPGVVRLVSFGGAPVIVHDSEISAIRRIVQSSLIPQPHTFLRVGERVMIVHGPLKDVEGIIIRDGKTKLVLSVEALQRSIAVEVKPDWLSPLEPRPEVRPAGPADESHRAPVSAGN